MADSTKLPKVYTEIRTPLGDSAMDDTNDAMRVNIVAGAAAGGTSSTDDAAFTAGSGSGTPSMGFFSADTVDAGDVGVLAMDASRRLLVSIEVDNVGIGGGTQYAVDTGLGATPTGTLAVVKVDAALSALTPIDGDADSLRVDANGALWVIPSGTVTVDLGANNDVTVTGTVDLGATDNAVLDAIAASVAGTLTVGSHAVTNAGTFVVQEDGAALTALQLIDDVIFVDDTATHTAATTKVAGIGVVAVPTDTSVNANDIAMPGMSTDRRLWTDTQIVGQDADITIADGGNNISVDWAGTVPPIGAGTEAAALRVTLATNSTGVVSVDDNGAALTVDNAGTFATQVDGAALTALQLIDDPIATISSTPLQRVAIFDNADTQITTFGGGTQYTEDAAAAADPVGTATILVRQDTPATLVTADADNVAQRGTNYGAAYTQIVTSTGSFVDTFGGSGGTSHTDDAAFTIASASSITPMGALADETTPDSVDEGDAGLVRMTLDRKLLTRVVGATDGNRLDIDASGHAQVDIAASSATVTVDASGTAVPITDNGGAITVDWAGTAPPIGAGTEAAALRVTLATDSTGVVSIDDNAGSLTVDGTVTASAQPGVDIGDVTINNASGASAVNIQDGGNSITVDGTVAVSSVTTSVTPGTAAGNLGKAEDAAHTTGDVGVMALSRRIDTLATSAGTDGDYATINTNATGALYVQDSPSTTQGLTISRLPDVDETEDAVKTSGGNVYFISAQSIDATPLYLHFYDATVATVVVGTTVPVATFILPAQSDGNGGGLIVNIDKGLTFATAITVAATTTIGGTTGPGANECVVCVGYK